MTASGHRECCSVGARGTCDDSSQDKVNSCHIFMSTQSMWYTSVWDKLRVVTQVCRCSKFEQTCQRRGP